MVQLSNYINQVNSYWSQVVQSESFQRVTSFIKRRWYIVLGIFAFMAPAIALAVPFMKPDAPWDSSPKIEGERIVFDKHVSFHPGHYNISERLNIFRQVDPLGMFFGEKIMRARVESKTFPMTALPGTKAPDFDLLRADGGRFGLSDQQGKVSVFMFVAMTCPPARTQVPLWTTLNDKYSQDDVSMFFVYSRERHATERGFREFKDTTNDEEKLAYAKMMTELTDLPIAVDGVDEEVLKSYGIVPNAAYVVDQEGYIVFKSQWADVNKVEKVIDQLLAM